MVRHVVLTAVLAIGAMATSAAADDDDVSEAEALALEATAIGNQGDFAGAIPLLQQAIAIDDLPRYRCPLAVAHYKLEHWPQAHLLFGICLEHSGQIDTKTLQDIPAVYAYAEKKLGAGEYGSVHLSVTPATATITVSAFDERESFTVPRTVWLPVGGHEATISAPGYDTKVIQLEIARGQNELEPIALERSPIAAGDDDDDAPPGDDDDDGPGLVAPGGTSDRMRPPSRTGAYISFGVAGAGLLGGAVFHLLALGTVDELEGLGDGDDRNEKIDELKLERTFMAGLYTAGAIAAAVGIYLWLKAKPRSAGLEVGAAPTGDGAGGMVWLHWRR
jgi:hypothetical protein